MLVKRKELERKIQNRLTTLINNEKWEMDSRWIKTYLFKRYNKHVRILTIDEISRLGDNEIPIEWRELFYNDDIKGRIDLLLNIWGEM